MNRGAPAPRPGLPQEAIARLRDHHAKLERLIDVMTGVVQPNINDAAAVLITLSAEYDLLVHWLETGRA